jgi:hypothetical protein
MPRGVLVTLPFPSTTTSTTRLIGVVDPAAETKSAATASAATSASPNRLVVTLRRE